LEKFEFLEAGDMIQILTLLPSILGQALGQLVETLHYKPEGRVFDSRYCHGNFSLTTIPTALWPWG
jgi:hypothetical protein